VILSFRRGVELAGSVLEPAIWRGVAPGAILAYSSICGIREGSSVLQGARDACEMKCSA
jgi:hypothetical protein